MEPTLHCARPEPGCEAGRSDRVLANRFIYRFRDPRRGEIVVFHAPKAAETNCIGGIFVKRIIGLPGEVWAERSGFTYIDGKRLSEPYVLPERRGGQEKKPFGNSPPPTKRPPPRGQYPLEGGQPAPPVDLRAGG